MSDTPETDAAEFVYNGIEASGYVDIDFCRKLERERDEAKTELNRACEMAAAPSTHLRPRLFPDGNMWCALYGENLQEGLAGFGKTPEGAMADFDHNFRFLAIQPND